MNLDRAVAILGILVGVLGAAAGVYVSQKDYVMGLLLASGWVAAALIGSSICVLAFRAITAMEKAHGISILAMEKARDETNQKAEGLSRDVIALQADVNQFRNIAAALSAVITQDVKPKQQSRGKRPGPSAKSQGATAENPVIGNEPGVSNEH